ncbi:MAG: MBL fold metallo-hydrolase [Treponema sp.]|nr:MBL fold metallo-hydrolase [Treponema sp.]MDY5758466.1 MBL fold metallo-hydrolase [Treponema sp.]
MPLINLTPEISYLPSVESPISSDVVFIKPQGSDTTWIFDTGTCSEAAEFINAVEGKKNIVISHFHPDHILNLLKVKYDKLYVTKYTKKYTRAGEIVDGELLFPDGIKISQIPSSHSKGALILEYKDYAFLGDATYCHFRLTAREYNVQLLEQMIKKMEEITAPNFCLSHDKGFVQPKESVLRIYRKILARRKNGSPTINVNDFFNEDGGVKESEDSLGNNVKVKI